MITHYGLGFGAGVLSLLAPCVLPLTPMIFGSSLLSSKFGPIAKALGLTLSFTIVGILSSLFATIFNIDIIQKFGAFLLIVVGITFLFPKVKDFISSRLSFVANKGNQIHDGIKSNDLIGEFIMGTLLGMIWAPCSGPTLAFAFAIATQADQFINASLIFFFFGLGAGLGLIFFGFLLQKVSGLTGKILKNIRLVNSITGGLSIIVGVLLLTGQMSNLEELILNISPQWLINLSIAI